MLFSKTTMGFYVLGWNYEIPDDAIEISDDLYHQLIDGLSKNKKITVDKNGFPCILDIEKTSEQLAEEYRAKRDALLSACDWTQVADAPVDQAAWKVYRQALRDIPEQKSFPTNIVWPNQPE